MAHSHPSPAMSDWTASSSSPMLPYKQSGKTAYMPIDSQSDLHPSSPALHNLQTMKRIQYYNNIFSQILGLFSVALTASMDGILLYVLYKFYTTRSIPAPSANPPRTSPWANDTQLWPAFMLAISSAVTFVIDVIGLIASCCTSRGKGTSGKVASAMTNAGYVVFVLKWVAVAVLYRIGKTTKDLWGWSCDERAKKIQQFYLTELNFDALCMEQTYAWYLSIAEWGVKAILMVVAFVLAWKVKRLNRRR